MLYPIALRAHIARANARASWETNALSDQLPADEPEAISYGSLFELMADG